MRTGIAAMLIVVAAASASAQTEVVYQGRLTQNNQPANGSFDMDFRLIDPFNNGNEAARFCRQDVQVVNGLFTTVIDLGPISRDLGYFVRVSTRPATGLGCGNETGFTTLIPDQVLGNAPRAIHAMSASSLGSPDGSPNLALQVNNDGSLVALGNLQVNGGLGLGTTTPTGRLDMRSNDGGYFRFMGTSEDIRFNGGGDGAFGFFNDSTLGTARTDFIAGGAVRLSINSQGRVGINTNVPTKALTVAGDMEVGLNSADYHHFRIGGGNSNGFIYGSYPGLGDGIHMGYNIYYTPTGNQAISNPGGGTSRVTTSYGWVALATGGVNAPPVDRLVVLENGRVGIGTSSPSTILDVAGTVRCVVVSQTSSARFKDDVAPLRAGRDELMNLMPVSYTWNATAPEEVRGKHDLGFIAEEVAKVLPDAVTFDDQAKATGVDYSRITVLAVKTIQQQQAQIESQRSEISSLNARLEALEKLLGVHADR